MRLLSELLDNLKKDRTAAVSGITAPAAAFLASSLRSSENLVVITPRRRFSQELFP